MRLTATLFTGLCLSAALVAGPVFATTQSAPQTTDAVDSNSDALPSTGDAAGSGDASNAPSGDGSLFKEGEPLEPVVETPQRTNDPAGASSDQPATGGDASSTETAAPAAVETQSGDQPASEVTAAEPVIDPLQTEMLRLIADRKGISKADRAALTEFYETRGADLLWVSGTDFTARAKTALAEIRQADDWGLEASAFELPSAPATTEPADIAGAELALSLAVLKYADHARGGRMDPKDLSNYIDRDLPLVPAAEVLAGVAASDAADAYLRKLHPQHPQFEKLRQAYLALRNGVPQAVADNEDEEDEAPAKGRTKRKAKKSEPAEKVTLRKLLVNMEQWRWMPEDLGQFHVWANIPEFTLRVMKHGEPIFTERLIVGKRDTQTPVFSDKMAFIVFHPFWGVPDSIKVKEILPGLARGSGVMAKNGLRIQYRGRDIDPENVDWSQADIRNFHVYQPPGRGNVLGQMKFMFPNKHQVYMHDTPTKNLFNSSQRTFSHGCMRVRNPQRFAEVLLEQDKGWDGRRIASLLKGGQENNNITLDNKIPVHMTYFTAWVGDDGKVKTFADIYSHESRIQMGIDGKAHLIVKKKDDLGPVRAGAVSRLAETRSSGSSGGGGAFSSSNTPDWARRILGN